MGVLVIAAADRIAYTSAAESRGDNKNDFHSRMEQLVGFMMTPLDKCE
jgi:hypothetical protein